MNEPIAAGAEAPSTGEPDLAERSLYQNRELSWLDFNDRVLQLACDESLPLMERVKFLAIFVTNLDEFFMVRVAGLHDQIDARIDARGAEGLSPTETVQRVAARVRELDHQHAGVFSMDVRPALDEHGIRIVSCDESQVPRTDMAHRFREQIFPVLTPLAIGPGRPFPYISNLSLSLIVWLRDPELEQDVYARVKVPKEVLPRFVEIGRTTFIPLEAIIADHLDALFPGMEVVSHSLFRVTRDADFEVSDEADDLLQAVEDELRRRRFGEVVRLEVDASMDPALRARLIEWLDVDELQVYDVEGLLDLGDLWEIVGIEGFPELRQLPWTPITHPALQPELDHRRRPARRTGGDAPRRRAAPLPLPLIRIERRAVRRAGGRGPQRAGDQDDRVPHLGRLGAGAVADPGGGEGQAGRLHGGAQGALRRAAQHPLVTGAGGGGRARRPRHPRVEDPCQGDPRRAPRAGRHPPLRDARHRQLPRQERSPVRGLRRCSPPIARSGRRWRICSTPSLATAIPRASARCWWRPARCGCR